MEIKRTLELLEEFKTNGIPSSAKEKRFALVLEYQDCIMKSNPTALADFESGLDSEQRKLFFWANACTLAMDSFLGILKETYIIRKAQEVVDLEISNEDERYSALFAKLMKDQEDLEDKVKSFEACKKPIHKRIKKLKDRVDLLEQMDGVHRRTEGNMLAEITQLKRWASQNEIKANNFDELKALLV